MFLTDRHHVITHFNLRNIYAGKIEATEIDSTSTIFLNLFLLKDISVQPISSEIAELSVNFDYTINIDPVDQIIATTLIINDAQLVTAAQNLRASKLVDTIR